MDFEMDPGGGDIQKKAGRLGMYVFSSPEHHVIIGFRGTDDALDESDVIQKGEFALGTLVFQDAADGDDAES